MQVPLQTLDKLRCARCRDVLSLGPVWMCEDGASACGRCAHAPCAPVNHPYNALAALCYFPCKYEAQGCVEKVCFTAMRQHELDCPCRTYVCPVAPPDTCEWVGSRLQLTQHVRNCHPERMVQHPVTMEHNLTSESFNTMLLELYGVLFLVYTKICLETRNVYHSVRKLGQLSTNHTYTYRLNVSNDNGKITCKGKVLPEGPFVAQEDVAIRLEINLLMNLLKTFTNTVFTITIRELLSCYKCKKTKNSKQFAFFDEENDIFYCKHCYKGFHSCKFSKEGCLVRGKSEVQNHETFFCTYNTWCDECEEDIFEIYMLQHLQNQHHTWSGIQHLYTIYHLIIASSMQVNLSVSYKGESFFFIFTRDTPNESNKFLVQGRHDLLNLCCVLMLRNPKTKYSGHYSMVRVYNHSQFFWDVYLSQNELNLFVDEDQFEMGVDIRFV